MRPGRRRKRRMKTTMTMTTMIQGVFAASLPPYLFTATKIL
jgi:hypothetical protein